MGEILIRVERLPLIVYFAIDSHFFVLSGILADPVQSLVTKRPMCFMKGNSISKSNAPISVTSRQVALELNLERSTQHVICLPDAHSRTTAGGSFLNHRECI